MKAVSLFSGIGGFEVGFDRCGIETVLQAESDEHALSVLRYRYPDIPKVNDVRFVTKDTVEDVLNQTAQHDQQSDGEVLRGIHPESAGEQPIAGGGIQLVYGGAPCTDFSLAGLRAGIRGERSSLWFEFWRVLFELRPTWTVFENVGGLLSSCGCAPCGVTRERSKQHAKRIVCKCERSDCGCWLPEYDGECDECDARPRGTCKCAECQYGSKLRKAHRGRDLAIILAGLEDLGYGWAYRVLDARYFGVPQRRQRVIIVGCLRGSTRSAEVLDVCAGCSGHRPAGEGSRQGTPATTGKGTRSPRGAVARGTTGTKAAQAEGGTLFGTWDPVNITSRVNRTSFVPGGPSNTLHTGGMSIAAIPMEAATLTAVGHKDGVHMPGRHKEDDVNLIAFESTASKRIADEWRADEAPPLRRHSPLAIAGAMSVTIRTHNGERQFDFMDDEVSYSLNSPAGGGRRQENLIAGNVGQPDVASTVTASAGHHGHSSPRGDGTDNLVAATDGYGVRRLTPLECARLMGWPDEHIRWGINAAGDTYEIPDSHQYRMAGNGVVGPVMEWLGWRLAAVDRWIAEHEDG